MGGRALPQSGAQQHQGSRLGHVEPSRRFDPGIGIVTGIAAEAKCARVLTGNVGCSAGVPDMAAALARDMAAKGAQMLVSFGIAGGLSPDLRPGTLLLADTVVADGVSYLADTAWAKVLGARTGTVYGGLNIVHDVAEKAELFKTGAVAVDLESGPVARIAAEAQIPFVALRAIADPAWHGLPPAALIPLDANGQPRLGAVFASIAKRPGQIPGLIATALETRAALKSLLRACRVLAG